jgi:hypothetical protein
MKPRAKPTERWLAVTAAAILSGHSPVRLVVPIGAAELESGARLAGLPPSVSGSVAGDPAGAALSRWTPSRRRPALAQPVPVPPAIAAVTPVGGGVAPQVFQFPVNRAIPDGDFSGLADSRVLPVGVAPIQAVAVTLVLAPLGEGGFAGDLYVTLTHQGGGYAVLLNRAGRSAERPLGYSDNLGFNLTFADSASADIHRYRLTLTGTETVPLTGTLGGEWQPSGRNTDPLTVLKEDPRDATLASFAGGSQAGRWTLFVADVSGGGEYRLESWSLSVTPVPEPVGVCGVLGLGALAWVLVQRRRRARPRAGEA